MRLARQASTSSPRATTDRGRNVEGRSALAAAGLGEAGLDGGLVGAVVVGRREEDRQPAVGDLGGQLHVLGADGRQVDGQVGPAVEDALERLAQAGGVGALVGNLVVLAVVDQRLLAREDGAHDGDVFARLAQRLAVGLAVPAFHDLGAGEPQPQQHAAAGELVEGDGGHGRVGRRAGRHLHDGRAQVDALGLRADPGQRRDRIRAIGLGRPDRVEAQAIRLLDHRHGQRDRRARVADHQTKPHS